MDATAGKRNGTATSEARSAVLLANATVVTMDADRRILSGCDVLVGDGRILAVGAQARERHDGTGEVIDCTRKVVLPGLVDLHGYLGGSILKSVGDSLDPATRRGLLEEILSQKIDLEWWAADARLAAIERLRFGTTFMFSMMGGNGTRTDNKDFVRVARRSLEEAGLRSRIGLGPARPPWPRTYVTWEAGKPRERAVSFETVIDNCDTLLGERAGEADGLVDYCVALSRFGNRNEHDPVWSPEREQWVGRQAEACRDLMDRHDVGFWTHAYGNSVEYAADEKLGLLGPRSILSHCTDISERAIAILKETGTSVAHHPRAARIYTAPGRCPLPELIDAGVTVALGADSPSNHDCDIFLDMKAAIMAQRMHFKDPRLLPAGKTLEMATIDGYRALGLDHELGSVEAGKKADLIAVDFDRPHLSPIDMPVHRLVYQASGHDVSHVIVDGQVVVRDGAIQSVDQRRVIDEAEEMYRRVLERAGIDLSPDDRNQKWGVSRA